MILIKIMAEDQIYEDPITKKTISSMPCFKNMKTLE